MLYENDPENNAVVKLFWGIIFFSLWIVEQSETFLSYMPDSVLHLRKLYLGRDSYQCSNWAFIEFLFSLLQERYLSSMPSFIFSVYHLSDSVERI